MWILLYLLSGCYLNRFVDWKWACKTNTLGWEQCDVIKRKEMKEKAMRRKQMDKDQFDEKKMNLSLKEFEDEKENDERYMNIERFLST